MPSTATLRLPPHRHPVPTRTRLRTRRVPLLGYLVVLLLVPVVVLIAAHAGGWWVTDGHTLPSTALGGNVVSTPGPGTALPGASGGAPVLANPQDVRGSMTVRQVTDTFPQVSVTEIYQLFGVPADTATATQLKTLVKDGNGYEIDAFRDWLTKRLAATG